MIKVRKAHTASFDVDAQKTFTPLCPSELPVPGGDLIVDELNRQAQFAAVRIGSKDAHHAGAVWVADEQHPPLSPIEGEPNADTHWPRHAEVGTPGFELLDGLPRPAEYSYFIWKGVEPDMHPYGACYHDLAGKMSTGVIEWLEARHIDTVIVGGLATDYCIKATVLQLREAGFRVIVNWAAVRGVDPDTTSQALIIMREAGAEFIDSASELVFEPAPKRSSLFDSLGSDDIFARAKTLDQSATLHELIQAFGPGHLVDVVLVKRESMEAAAMLVALGGERAFYRVSSGMIGDILAGAACTSAGHRGLTFMADHEGIHYRVNYQADDLGREAMQLRPLSGIQDDPLDQLN